ncbi:MAG: outer membrane protein [Burkholderiales bacterium]
MKQQTALGVLALTLAGLHAMAGAQETASDVVAAPSPWYMGVGFSKNVAKIPQSTVDAVGAAIVAGLGQPPLNLVVDATVIEKDERNSGAKIMVGYAFSPKFALEGTYLPEVKSTVDYDFRSGLNSVGVFSMRYQMEAFSLDAVGSIPLGEKWSVLGRVGVSLGRTRVQYEGSPVTLLASSDERTKTQFNAKFGAGMQYDFLANMGLRAEWENYRFADPTASEKIKVNSFSASFIYRF